MVKLNKIIIKEIITDLKETVRTNYYDKTYKYSQAVGSPAADSIKERYLKVLDELETELNQINKEEFKSYFKIKIGNAKLSDLIYNFEAYYNCSTRAECSNCLVCYAKAHEPTEGVFKSRTKNIIFKEYVIRSNEYSLLIEAVKETNFKSLLTSYNRLAREKGKPELNSLKNVKYLRLCEQGAIKKEDLEYAKILILNLMAVFKNLKVYTYSHDPNLKSNYNFNVNRSLDINELIEKKELKENVFINYSTKEELKIIVNHARHNNIKKTVCPGDCTKCNSCKENHKHIIICKTH